MILITRPRHIHTIKESDLTSSLICLFSYLSTCAAPIFPRPSRWCPSLVQVAASQPIVFMAFGVPFSFLRTKDKDREVIPGGLNSVISESERVRVTLSQHGTLDPRWQRCPRVLSFICVSLWKVELSKVWGQGRVPFVWSNSVLRRRKGNEEREGDKRKERNNRW